MKQLLHGFWVVELPCLSQPIYLPTGQKYHKEKPTSLCNEKHKKAFSKFYLLFLIFLERACMRSLQPEHQDETSSSFSHSGGFPRLSLYRSAACNETKESVA